FSNDQVAGTCGKLYVNNRGWTKLLNPITSALVFEHKISNIINKPFESIFGYISSLSKDFSAYRYSAFQNITNDTEDASNNNILAMNDYFANNDVICFELISKRNSSWILHYENSSQAEVDVPENLPEMFQQYVCKFNEYYYTSSYAIMHFFYIWRSGHSILQYHSNEDPFPIYFYPTGFILFYIYIAITGMQFIFAIVNKPQNLVEITDVNSFTNTFGKNIVEVSLPCKITIDDAYNKAWNEIIIKDKNGTKV
ncbi:20495_t:CDS:2, partial [Dentiscutata erythropus]